LAAIRGIACTLARSGDLQKAFSVANSLLSPVQRLNVIQSLAYASANPIPERK
jgi:hypothetical protein